MPQVTDLFELEKLGLRSGEGRFFELHAAVDGFSFGGQRYDIDPSPMPVRLDISRTTHSGYAMRLRFRAAIHGPCMRCLEPAEPGFDVDVREVFQPGGVDQLMSPYVVEHGDLDLRAWTRDALALTAPAQITCRPDCAGLCPVCGVDLNDEGGRGRSHAHEAEPDPRWAKLRELKLD